MVGRIAVDRGAEDIVGVLQIGTLLQRDDDSAAGIEAAPAAARPRVACGCVVLWTQPEPLTDRTCGSYRRERSMDHTNDLFCRLLEQVVMAEEPLAHPRLEDVPDSEVRDHVRSMLDRGLVEGELHTALGGQWTVYPGLEITRLGRSYLSRHREDRGGWRKTAYRTRHGFAEATGTTRKRS